MKRKLSLVLVSALSILILVLSGCAASGSTATGTTGVTTSPATNPAATTGGETSSTATTSTTGTASNATTGQIQVRVTDAPANKDVTSVDVTVASIEVEEPGIAATSTLSNTDTTTTTSTLANTDTTTTTALHGQEHGNPHNKSGNTDQNQNQDTTAQSTNGGWITLNFSGNNTFDLLKVKNLEDELANSDLAAGDYNQVRMDVSKVVVGFKDGTTATAKLPSGKLRFVHPFEIAAGKTTVLLFDFDAAKSIVETGNGQVIFKPVIKLSVTKTPGKMQIMTSALPNGEVDQAYTATTLTAMGGITPYTWSITSGSIPGLTLDATTGVLSGTPTTAGSYPITVKVTDNSSPAKSDTQQFTVKIAAAGVLQITSTSLPDGMAGTAYSATLQSAGGTAPVTWSIDSGSLPAGLTLDGSTGTISGTPTTKGDYTFTVKVTDNASTAATATQSLTIHVNEVTSA